VKVIDGSATKATTRTSSPTNPRCTAAVRVAMVDVSRHGTLDIITVRGAGGGSGHSRVDGTTGALIRQFFAYDPAFHTAASTFRQAMSNGHERLRRYRGRRRCRGGEPNVTVFSGKGGLLAASLCAYNITSPAAVRVATARTPSTSRPHHIVRASGPRAGRNVPCQKKKKKKMGLRQHLISLFPLIRVHWQGSTWPAGVQTRPPPRLFARDRARGGPNVLLFLTGGGAYCRLHGRASRPTSPFFPPMRAKALAACAWQR